MYCFTVKVVLISCTLNNVGYIELRAALDKFLLADEALKI